MTREVQIIPPAPRRSVRWSAALWYRWPLALAGFLLLVYGGLWTSMLWFASAGRELADRRLDEDATSATGRAIEVTPTHVRIGEREADLVHYRFPADGGVEVFGRSFAPRGHGPGDVLGIEYLTGEIQVSRVAGGRIGLLGDFATPFFWLTVVPGMVLTGIWLLGVVRTRRLLVQGDVAVARIAACRRVRGVVPTMLAVEFTFRDRRARERAGRHWVRERSSLGMRLLHAPTSVAVVHDRARPERYRLVAADAFSPTAPRGAATR